MTKSGVLKGTCKNSRGLPVPLLMKFSNWIVDEVSLLSYAVVVMSSELAALVILFHTDFTFCMILCILPLYLY